MEKWEGSRVTDIRAGVFYLFRIKLSITRSILRVSPLGSNRSFEIQKSDALLFANLLTICAMSLGLEFLQILYQVL